MLDSVGRFGRDVGRARWPIMGVAATAILANLATMAITGQQVFARGCLVSPLCGVGGRASLVALFGVTVAATVVAVRSAFPVRSTRLEQRSRRLHALVIPLSELGEDVSITVSEDPPALHITGPGFDPPVVLPVVTPFTGDALLDRIDALGRMNLAPALRGIAEHASLKRVTLLSSGGGPRGGSDVFVDALASYLRQCGLVVDTVSGLDFTDLDAVGGAVDSAIDRLVDANVAEGRIALDVTPGQKLTSIGAAFASLHREVLIQYVDKANDGSGAERWRVTTYDTTLRQN